MLDKLLFVLTQKLAVLFVAGLSVVGGLLSMGSTHSADLSQTAIVSNVAGSTANAMASLPSSLVSSSAMIAVNLPSIPLGLLPSTTIPFCPENATSTCSRKNIKALIRLSSLLKKISPAKTSTVAVVAPATIPVPQTPPPTAPVKKILPAAVPLPNATATTATTTQTITAQSFLDNTTSTLKILLNGSNQLGFTTNLGGGQAPLTWGLLTTTIGGTGSVPQFSVTSSCNPAPQLADLGASDKNPTFDVRTAYDCSVSLTPETGSDRVTRSKDFSFATPAGELVAMSDSAMSTLLANNTNNGGLVFNNQDTHPVTITGITFDISYSYLTTLNGPLVLRFLNPATDQSLVDYHMENMSADPSTSNSYSQSAVTLSLSFTIPPQTRKMLPVQVLGVNRMLMSGTSPTVKVILRGATTDQSDVKVVLNSPSVTWSCGVSATGYDPNATSGVYATGQACLN